MDSLLLTLVIGMTGTPIPIGLALLVLESIVIVRLALHLVAALPSAQTHIPQQAGLRVPAVGPQPIVAGLAALPGETMTAGGQGRARRRAEDTLPAGTISGAIVAAHLVAMRMIPTRAHRALARGLLCPETGTRRLLEAVD